jgi:hypothetical protein
MSLLCRDQLSRRCLRILLVLSTVVSVEGIAAIAGAQQVRVVPSIAVREIYDSNVFYADESTLPAGLSKDDFITMFVPQITVSQSNSLVSTNLMVGALIQKFAKNSDLDNVGFNAAAGVDISRLANRYLPRMRTARFYGTYMYSPSTPPFGAGGMGGTMGGMGGGMMGGGMGMMGGGMMGGIGRVGIAGPLDSGLLAQRTRVQIYNIGFNSSYALSPSADFQTSLTYSRLSFGGSLTPTQEPQVGQALTFDTTSYNVSAGPMTRISAVDSIGFNYVFSQTSQANFGQFTTHTGNLNWSRAWTQEISSSVRGGMTLIEPIPINRFSAGAAQASSQGRVAATMFPTGGFSVTYASASSLLRAMGSEVGSISPSGGVGVVGGSFLPVLAGSTVPGTSAGPGMYSVSLLYNLGVYPSFVASAGPIYTHLISLVGSAGITERLSGFGGFNYGHSSFTSQVNTGTFDSYGTVVMLNYLVTRSLQASLSHQWLNFSGGSAVASASDFSLSKHMVMLGISYAYSPRGDFFRSGAFWESPPSGSSTTGSVPGQSGSGGVEIKK